MSERATGTFDIDSWDEQATDVRSGATVGRVILAKTFHGDLLAHPGSRSVAARLSTMLDALSPDPCRTGRAGTRTAASTSSLTVSRGRIVAK
ncbi:MAG TPA: DUF3224 domain-containing protein [Streptosporangiaceae bacterium]|jgi:hypothetical protein